MKISKIAATLVLAIAIVGVNAQPNIRTTAINAFRDAQGCMKDKDMACAKKNILEAKKYIDQSSEHEDTKNDPKNLFYKGQIYMTLAALGMLDVTMKEYATEENMKLALASFKASIANKNKKSDFTDEIKMLMVSAEVASVQAGIEAYNKKEYRMALDLFQSAAAYMDVIGIVDTIAYYNAGLSADRLQSYDTAAMNYKKCAEVGYQGADSYQALITSLTEAGKVDEAFKYIQEGRAKYPGNKDLLISEVNYHLKKGNMEDAEKATNLAIEKDPKNPVLYFVVGTIYDELKQYEMAEKSYKKAIELKPDYFDALYNLGAMYHNFGVEQINKINDITDNTLYQAEKKKADQKFADALPYLEKCREIDAKDMNTVIMMRNCYSRLGMQEKWKEMDDLYKNNK